MSEAKPRVLVVDDDSLVLEMLTEDLGRGDFEVAGVEGAPEAVGRMLDEPADVVLADYVMPVMNGLELLSLVRRCWPVTACVLMTGFDIRLPEEVTSRRLVHGFVAKPWSNGAVDRVLMEAIEAAPGPQDDAIGERIRRQARKAALALAHAVDARDPHTRQHSEKVAAYALVLGRAFGMSDTALADLFVGAMLHDLGKVGVSGDVLHKPASLTDAEVRSVRTHPKLGAALVQAVSYNHDVATVVGQHHENHDGTGYPNGSAGEEIPLSARIARVADAFEAMSAHRAWRSALAPMRVVDEILAGRGERFDPEVTDAFMQELIAGRIGAGRDAGPGAS